MSFKIKIQELPSLEKAPSITTSIKDNPYKANAEIEKGEYILRPDMGAIYKAVGRTHKQGGIDTYLPDGSFVFSDDPTLYLKQGDYDAMELKSPYSSSKKDNTPAEVLKKNIDTKHYNKMTSILDDKKATEFHKRTAAMMLNKYEDIAGRVAYVQESKKDFPDGVPEFAQGTAPVYNNEVKNNIMEQKQYMKRGGYFQLGGKQLSSRSKNPQQLFDPKMLGYLMNNEDAILSPSMKGNPFQQITSPQHKLANGDYGQNFDRNEYKQRQDWYFKDHPNFDFNKESDVKDFQHSYNNLSQKMYGSDYFGIDDGFRGIDGKAGLYTQSAPNIYGKEKPMEGPALPEVSVTEIRKKPVEDVKPVVKAIDVPPSKRQDINWDFNPWQKMNMGWDALNAASVHQEFPYRSQVSSPLVELERLNPQSALNNADNSAYKGSQSLKGLNPYLAAGQTASIYGQNLDAKQQIQSQYDNQNVGIGNEQNLRNQGTQQADQRYNIDADQRYYRESVEGRKNFDNLKQTSWGNFRNNLNSNVEQNMSLAYQMASQPNAPWGYESKTGQFYTKGKNPLDVQTNATGDIINQYIQKIGTGFDKMTPDIQVKFLHAMIGNKALQLPQYANSSSSFKKGGMKKNPYKK